MKQKQIADELSTDETNSVSTTTDPIFKKYGKPFKPNESGKIVLNTRAIAVKCATVNQVKYIANTKTYERFDTAQGLWLFIHEVEVLRLVDDLLIELGRTYNQQPIVELITPTKLASLAKMMRPHDIEVEMEDSTGLVHASNGVVDLNGKSPKLLSHQSKYPFHHTSGIKFDTKATCRMFLNQLLGPALLPDDIKLLQMYCGSMLLGPNTCHGIMIIRGTAGGGKSTLVTVIEKIFGENNVAHLRASHLGGRFETSAFLGKRLLVGKDVPGDTLATNGARMLKSLVGGDMQQAEIKFNPDKQMVRGDFHVIVVSNNKLRIALDGDEEAWRRRLLVVDFSNPKPSHPIASYAEKLVEQEGSGILNWLIDGAQAYRMQMKKHGHLDLTDSQKARITTLLHDSDNVPVFVKKHLTADTGSDVTSEELLLSYYQTCNTTGWTPVSQHQFQTRIPELLGQQFRSTRRNDITREGRALRGFKNIKLV